MSLSNGKTDGIADTLTKGTGGDLNAGGVVGLGVTGSDRVDRLCRNNQIRRGIKSERGLPLTRNALRSSSDRA